MPPLLDSFRSRRSLAVGGRNVDLYRPDALDAAGVGHVSRLPFSLKILRENLLPHEDGRSVTKEDIAALATWDPTTPSPAAANFHEQAADTGAVGRQVVDWHHALEQKRGGCASGR